MVLKRFLPRKRILIVNCYFDELRRPIRRSRKIPQVVSFIFLFASETENPKIRLTYCLFLKFHTGGQKNKKMLKGVVDLSENAPPFLIAGFALGENL